jgi:hypothetical protein
MGRQVLFLTPSHIPHRPRRDCRLIGARAKNHVERDFNINDRAAKRFN